MRLLILTQVVNSEDQVLGFFHRWIVEFAEHCELVTVVCLKEGPHTLPYNVKVLSLGKEKNLSRLGYVFNFYRHIWRERKRYDAVFVHMNEEYLLLGGLFWKVWGKRIAMWRNHPHGTMLTKAAVFLSDHVFCTSPKSYTAKFDKTAIMPAGIDTNLYLKRGPNAEPNSILFFGRLSPIKNAHLFIDALLSLDKEGNNFHADIVGSPANPEDASYEKSLWEQGKSLVNKGQLSFKHGISHDETASLYGKYSLYVNLTPDGSLDKTMLEAMASRTPVLVSNSAFGGHIPAECQVINPDTEIVGAKIKSLLSLSESERSIIGEQLSSYVEENHSLRSLIKQIVKKFSN